MSAQTIASLLLFLAGLFAGLAAAYGLWRNRTARKILSADAPSADEGRAALPQIANILPVPALVVDAKGLILYANAAASAAFGNLLPGSLLYLKFRAPEMRLAIETALAKHENTAFEMAERVPVEHWFRVDVCHLPTDTPDEKNLALFFRDQSESHKLDRMRSDFVANASHELRTPLASMTGFIETLKGPARDDAAARDRFLDIMQQQAGRMARLIDDLLSLSRLEMRPVVALDQNVDLQSITDHVLDAMRPLCVELGVAIERNFGAGPFVVPGVRDELIQVIENLVENACKYGQHGKKVVVSLSRNGGEIRMSFRDFGPGIAADHIPRLTERFYRVDAGSSRAQKGTGLGLAIVKHILTRHHARLSIQSELGAGSEFAVNFLAPDAAQHSSQ